MSHAVATFSSIALQKACRQRTVSNSHRYADTQIEIHFYKKHKKGSRALRIELGDTLASLLFSKFLIFKSYFSTELNAYKLYLYQKVMLTRRDA